MSSVEDRKVSLQEIQLVQNLIERCLQLYMSKKEVVNTLSHQAKIEPDFTELVWQKLEAENQDFFRAYNMRLIVKYQIGQFNQLLARQVELMRQKGETGVSLTPLPNGSQTHSIDRNLAHREPQPNVPCIKSKDMFHVVGVIPNDYTNGAYSPQQHMEVAANMPGHAGRMDFPAHTVLTPDSNVGIMQGFNERTIKTEGVYAGTSPVMFGGDHNLSEARSVVREASIYPFKEGESCSQSFNESMLETEINSFRVEHMPPNLSLSDRTAAFSRCTDILESYSESPFMATDPDLLDPHQDFRRLEAMSEGFIYEAFGSNRRN